MNKTDWLPGIRVLIGGLLVAALYLYTTWRKAPPAAKEKRRREEPGEADDGVLEDLDRRAQLLLEELKELTAERHHLSEERFAAEKARLETAAAAALRARDEHLRGVAKAKASSSPSPSPAARPSPSPQGFFATHPQLKGALWGGGVVIFIVALVLLLGQNEKARGDGDSITGKDPNAVAEDQRAGEEEQFLRQALEALQAHPEDVKLAAEVGHELIWRRRPDEAAAVTERALSADPFHLENRIHQAALGAFRGDPQGALRKLQHLADTYPDGHEALLFLGSIYMQMGDSRHALESFERFAAQAPASEQPPGLQQGISMLRQQLGIQP